MKSILYNVFGLLPADPVSLPLIDTPIPSWIIIGTYLYVVLKAGPNFMRFRQPFNVRKAMLAYNLFQVLMNGGLFLMGNYYLIAKQTYTFRCMGSLPLDHPHKNADRWLTYLYFLNKVLDLMDTVFFVLRKSHKQVTVLHLYHHSLMVLGIPMVYYAYGPGGQYNLMGYLNSFVHVVMYAYYFVAALNPSMKNKLWWKEYITKLQILQFLILFAQPWLTMYYYPSCPVPMVLHILQLFVSTSMTIMFGKFYYQTYVKVKSKPQ